MAYYKKLPGSLCIKSSEKMSKNDVLALMLEYMTIAEEVFGIEEFKVYAFLDLIKDNKKHALYIKDQKGIVQSLPYITDKHNKNTDKTTLSANKTNFSFFNQELNTERLANLYNKTKEDAKLHSVYLHNIEAITAYKADQLANADHYQQQKERREREAENERIRELEYKLEAERKAKAKAVYEIELNEFVAFKAKEHNVSIDEYKKKILYSYAYLEDNTTKARFFKDRQDLVEKYRDVRLMRLSFKNSFGKVCRVEIYNEERELIFTQVKQPQLVKN
jgi:hypothetical protein